MRHTPIFNCGTMRTLLRITAAGTIVLAVAVPVLSQTADPALEKGKTLFNTTGACFSCHGPEGKGDGPAAVSLNPKPRSFAAGEFLFDTDGDGKKGTETDISNVIANGAVKYGGSVLMPPRPDIPEEDRKAVAKYVLSLAGK